MATFTLRAAAGTSALRAGDTIRPRTFTSGWHLYLDGVDAVTYADFQSLDLQDTGKNATGRLQARLADPSGTASVPPSAFVELVDGTNSTVTWSGRIISRAFEPGYAKAGRDIAVEAVDLGAGLDSVVIVDDTIPDGWDDRRAVQYLVNTYGAPTGVRAPDLTVDVTNGAIYDVYFTNKTLREALETVAAAAGDNRGFYVNPDGQLVYGLLSTSPAPYAISDAPDGTASIAAEELAYEADTSGIVNAVYVASAPEDAIYGAWVTDATSISTYGRREAYYVNENVVDAATAEQYGRPYLAERKDPTIRGSVVVTGKDGWKAGQTLSIASQSLGLAGGTSTTTSGTAYASAVAASSPVSYWRLSDSTGTVATATNGADGTYVGSPTLGVTGALANDTNTAVTFNGTSQLVTAPLFTTGITNWTLEAWVKPTTTSQASLIVHNGINTNGFGFGIGNAADGTGTKLVGLFGNVAWYDTGYSFTDTNWHHIVFTRDTTTTRAYVDGTATPNTSALTPLTPTTRLTIGALSNGIGASYYFRYAGAVDEVAAYTSALSATEVLAHYNAGITGVTSTTTSSASTSFLISQVDTQFLTGLGKRRYRIAFGALPKSLVRLLAAT